MQKVIVNPEHISEAFKIRCRRPLVAMYVSKISAREPHRGWNPKRAGGSHPKTPPGTQPQTPQAGANPEAHPFLSHLATHAATHATTAHAIICDQTVSSRSLADQPPEHVYRDRIHSRRGDAAKPHQSLADRHHNSARYLHGIARHRYCERVAPSYCRRTRHQLRREHRGADVLPGCQRDRAAPERLAKPGFRSQELLYDLCCLVQYELADLRPGPRTWVF
jgi:hypothetical protein